MARKIGGIAGVLEHVTGGERREKPGSPPDKAKALPAAKVEEKTSAGVRPAHTTVTVRRVRARTGRPPGRKSGEQPRKEKATLWINAEVMADYREWAWEVRCNLGELIDQALGEYKRRHRKVGERLTGEK